MDYRLFGFNAFSALTLLVGWQEEHLARKTLSDDLSGANYK